MSSIDLELHSLHKEMFFWMILLDFRDGIFLFSLGITLPQFVWDVCCILYRKKMTVLMHLLHNVSPLSLLFSCHTNMLLYIFTCFQKNVWEEFVKFERRHSYFLFVLLYHNSFQLASG
ncbi:hypothetical protein IHE45_04G147500 [Dioscorea alata]|uniref:Uncharacterized protein n=2 Tax=Dioscorea alata TaxID=55571 RepID=A0ACB7WGP5_DIOAL|nr:hypothetical protein IHE45_04G147500 [Dioscorea alata]KAH7687103.1 hypothetical protein IHE45_04G147500 [Dioscorea alata]